MVSLEKSVVKIVNSPGLDTILLVIVLEIVFVNILYLLVLMKRK